MIKTLIESIRQDIAIGRCPTADVLRLCDETENLLAVAIKMEKAVHESCKILEKMVDK